MPSTARAWRSARARAARSATSALHQRRDGEAAAGEVVGAEVEADHSLSSESIASRERRPQGRWRMAATDRSPRHQRPARARHGAHLRHLARRPPADGRQRARAAALRAPADRLLRARRGRVRRLRALAGALLAAARPPDRCVRADARPRPARGRAGRGPPRPGRARRAARRRCCCSRARWRSGCRMPPMSAAARALWSELIDRALLPSVYALEAAVLEAVYIVGPLLIVGAIGSISLRLALVVNGTCVLAGRCWFAASRQSRAWRGTGRARAPLGRAARLVAACACCWSRSPCSASRSGRWRSASPRSRPRPARRAPPGRCSPRPAWAAS